MKPANLIKRVSAVLIDSLILISISLGALVISVSVSQNPIETTLLSISFLLFTGIFYTLAQSYLTAELGGSIGKLVMGIKVVRGNGRNLTFKRAIFRVTIGQQLASSLLMLGYFWIFMDEKRRGWHDLAAQSEVVESENKANLLITIVTISVLSLLSIIFTIALFRSAQTLIMQLDDFSPVIRQMQIDEKSNDYEVPDSNWEEPDLGNIT